MDATLGCAGLPVSIASLSPWQGTHSFAASLDDRDAWLQLLWRKNWFKVRNSFRLYCGLRRRPPAGAGGDAGAGRSADTLGIGGRARGSGVSSVGGSGSAGIVGDSVDEIGVEGRSSGKRFPLATRHSLSPDSRSTLPSLGRERFVHTATCTRRMLAESSRRPRARPVWCRVFESPGRSCRRKKPIATTRPARPRRQSAQANSKDFVPTLPRK